MRISFIILLALLIVWNMAPLAQAQKLDLDIQTLVEGNNDFAVTLYQRLAEKDGNLFLSPYSISNAFAMTYAGARGNTAVEMKTTLRFNLAVDRLHPAFSKLIAQLHEEKKWRTLELTVANRLWGQKNYGFLPAFTKTGADFYKAGLEEVDFVQDADGARKTINAWVEKQTNDKITNLVPPGVLNADSRLVLTNAIYFKAPWMFPFDPKATKDEAFYLANGQTVKVPLMHAKERGQMADLDGFSIASIPYARGEHGMIVLLPKKKDGLAELEKKLTPQSLSAWMKKLSTYEIDLKLPKFKVTAEFKLNDVMKQMGIKDAFIPGTADFSGMATGEKLHITAVLHKAFVDVNEQGTEAAAATAIGIGTTSLPQPGTFHADHPFLFLIRDHRNGTILFMGRVANPKI